MTHYVESDAAACPICGAPGVAACRRPGGMPMDEDHEGRPPYFTPNEDFVWRVTSLGKGDA